MKIINRKLSDTIVNRILLLLAGISVASVILITAFLVISGAPVLFKIGLKEFLLGTNWQPTETPPSYGIFTFILASIYGTIGAIIIGVPIGLLVAVNIAKLAPNRLANIFRPAINLLAGIPSVIYGLVGLTILVPFIGKVFNLAIGTNLLSAIIVLSIMVLPTIVSVSETSIRAVPESYMEASLALGVSKEYTVFNVLVPAAKSGIMAAILLGVGRALGEAMAVMMVSGNVPMMPSILGPVRFLTTGIVAEMSYADGAHRSVLIGIGLVLFVFIMIINSLFRYFIKKVGTEHE